MRSRAQILGHPLHPMIVPLPIGLWVASLVCDLAYLATRTPFWYDAAWWAMAGGVAGALLAAMPGVVDYEARAKRTPETKAIARAHMAINIGLTVLYALNLALRGGGQASAGGSLGLAVALSVLGVIGLGVAGWLGGELVYRHGLGVEGDVVSITQGEKARGPRPRV